MCAITDNLTVCSGLFSIQPNNACKYVANTGLVKVGVKRLRDVSSSNESEGEEDAIPRSMQPHSKKVSLQFHTFYIACVGDVGCDSFINHIFPFLEFNSHVTISILHNATFAN